MKKIASLILALILLPIVVFAELPANESAAVEKFFEKMDELGVLVTSKDFSVDPGTTGDGKTRLTYNCDVLPDATLSITYNGDKLASCLGYMDLSNGYLSEKSSYIAYCIIAAFAGFEDNDAMSTLEYLASTTEMNGPLGMVSRIVRGDYEILFGISPIDTMTIAVYPAE